MRGCEGLGGSSLGEKDEFLLPQDVSAAERYHHVGARAAAAALFQSSATTILMARKR